MFLKETLSIKKVIENQKDLIQIKFLNDVFNILFYSSLDEVNNIIINENFDREFLIHPFQRVNFSLSIFQKIIRMKPSLQVIICAFMYIDKLMKNKKYIFYEQKFEL